LTSHVTRVTSVTLVRMALASSWETTPATHSVSGLALPGQRHVRAIPAYPAGRHRGARRSFWASLASALTPRRAHVGRHRVGMTTTYRGRHSA